MHTYINICINVYIYKYIYIYVHIYIHGRRGAMAATRAGVTCVKGLRVNPHSHIQIYIYTDLYSMCI